MKLSISSLIAVSAVSFLAGTSMPTIQTQSGPAVPATSSAYFIVDYMKSEPGQADAYVRMEQQWKAVHRERMKAGKITGWQLYGLRYPNGTGLEYDFVVVERYPRFENLEDPLGGKEVVSRALPGMDPAEFFSRTEATRKIVRSEVWALVDELK
jgi:hypothetical protein